MAVPSETCDDLNDRKWSHNLAEVRSICPHFGIMEQPVSYTHLMDVAVVLLSGFSEFEYARSAMTSQGGGIEQRIMSVASKMNETGKELSLGLVNQVAQHQEKNGKK